MSHNLIIPYIFHLCHLGKVGIPCHRSAHMEGQAIPRDISLRPLRCAICRTPRWEVSQRFESIELRDVWTQTAGRAGRSIVWLDTSADFPATPSEACQNRSGEDLGSGAPRFFNILLRSSPKKSGAHECYGNQPESEYNEQNNDGRLK